MRPWLVTAFAMIVALAVGGLLQEARWRGGLSGVVPSPIEARDQQLKLAQLAFRHGNDAVALNLFDRLAAQNDAVAQYWLAHMTELGLGVPKDIPRAISLYAKAAAQNSIPAEARLGEIYLNGDLTPPDYAKAFDLLGNAARQGDPRAAMLLGQMHRFGLGTAADPIESYAWSEVAVIEGLGFAKVEREAAFAAMSPSDREKGAARAAAILAEIHKKAAPPKKP
ncbi:MAG: tetratricopeptide repeat protein [Roseiarcus sp.]